MTSKRSCNSLSNASSSAMAAWKSVMSSQCERRTRTATVRSSPMRNCVRIVCTRAALDRNVRPERRQGRVEAGTAINDDQFRRLQAPADEIVEQRPPGRFTLASHILHCQQQLLAVLPHPKGDKKGDRCRSLVEPDPNHRPVEDETDDRLTGHRTLRRSGWARLSSVPMMMRSGRSKSVMAAPSRRNPGWTPRRTRHRAEPRGSAARPPHPSRPEQSTS